MNLNMIWTAYLNDQAPVTGVRSLLPTDDKLRLALLYHQSQALHTLLCALTLIVGHQYSDAMTPEQKIALTDMTRPK